jgi:hypothetical protein
MAMIFLSLQVAPADADAALDITSDLGYEARLIRDIGDDNALVLVQTLTIDDVALSANAAEQEVRDRVASALKEHGIEHRLIGSGADESSITRSLFTIRPLGAPEHVSTLQIRAGNRAEFEDRLASLNHLLKDEDWPPRDLVGFEVVVEGLAAGDPDVQEPPFLPKR